MLEQPLNSRNLKRLTEEWKSKVAKTTMGSATELKINNDGLFKNNLSEIHKSSVGIYSWDVRNDNLLIDNASSKLIWFYLLFFLRSIFKMKV